MTVFLVASFFILSSLFLAAPARAEVTCPDGGFVYDPTLPEIWQCCNYQNSPNHIPADTPDCNSTHCQTQNFPKNADSNTYGGVCRYCNTNVTVRIDGCSGCGCTCNQVCAAGGPPPDGDEGDCHMPDENLIACCPVEGSAAGSGLIDWIINAVSKIVNITLTVTNFSVSEKFEEATDYYYGKAYINEVGEEELEGGAFFKLAPPNLLQDYFPTKEAKTEKRGEDARWVVSPTNTSGDEGGDALNDGKLKNVEPYRLAVRNLRDFLIGIPKSAGPTAQKPSKTVLASSPSRNPSPQGPGEVLSSDDVLCGPEVVEAETRKTCTPSDLPERPADLSKLFDLVTGNLKLYTKMADLDFLGNNTTGNPAPEGAAADDPNYGPGFLQIFNLPGEEYEELNAKGSAELTLGNIPIIGSISLGRKDLELSHQGSDTEAREKENGVYAKLTVPQAGNGTALLRQDYGGPTAVVLASTTTPLDSLPRTSHSAGSFAESLGRTLGTWLGKLIML